jgi:hypothetical protein
MIHNVERDEIRFKSGRVIHVEPLKIRQNTEYPLNVLELAGSVNDIFDEVPGGYVVTTVFDRMDSIVAGDPCVVFLSQIETLTRRTVQIEAGEDAFK